MVSSMSKKGGKRLHTYLLHYSKTEILELLERRDLPSQSRKDLVEHAKALGLRNKQKRGK